MENKSEQIANMLLNYWFNNNHLWFDASKQDDHIITKKFINYLDIYKQYDYENTPKKLLSKIILYDQLTRHFYRDNEKEWKKYLVLACNLCKYGIQNKYDKFYSAEEKCFFIMPLRHSDLYTDVKLSLYKINEYKKTESHQIYNKFYYHTLKKYGKMENLLQLKTKHVSNYIPDFVLYYTIIDRECKSFFSNYNKMYYIYPNNDHTRMRKLNIYNKIYELIVTTKLKRVCVSLSGGVDSMVVLLCLIILRNHGLIDRLLGVHINYGNRYKSWLEREFVIRFCTIHKVELIIRDINEIKRNRKTREIYEDITRQIRFDMYKQINMPIFFGHNKDDCLENMITNIKKSQHYDNLYGMIEKTNINDIIIFRPLLEFTKQNIFEFANKLNLHHTRNSTPKWSDRWNIRNVFINFVDTKQPGFINGLTNITYILQESYKMINTTANSLVKQSIIDDNDLTISITIPDYIGSFEKEIWNRIIIDLCNKYNIHIPTHKSINNFLYRKNRLSADTIRVDMGKNLFILYKNIASNKVVNNSNILYTSYNEQKFVVIIKYTKTDEIIISRK